MARSDVQIQGNRKLVEALKKTFSKRKMNKIIREAMGGYPEEMVRRAKTNLGDIGTGRLANAMDTRAKFKRRGTTFVADALIKEGKKRSDLSGAYYAHMVDRGHRIVDRNGKVHGFQPPNPFWTKAFNSTYGPMGKKALLNSRMVITRAVASELRKRL